MFQFNPCILLIHKNAARHRVGYAKASAEQATGIDQNNTALTKMGEVTPQNSALVEQNAASAKSLENQTSAMDGQIRRFQIGEIGARLEVADSAATPSGAIGSRKIAICNARDTRQTGQVEDCSISQKERSKSGGAHAGRRRHRAQGRPGMEGILNHFGTIRNLDQTRSIRTASEK
jgi:hypothetical protein